MIEKLDFLESLSMGAKLNNNDTNYLIKEGLYKTPKLLSVDQVSFWEYDYFSQTYICKADFFEQKINNQVLPSFNALDSANIFAFLKKQSDIIIEDDVHDIQNNKFYLCLLSTLKVSSFILIPLNNEDINCGFLFIGNNEYKKKWSKDTIFVCKMLAELFEKNLLIYEKKEIQARLNKQNQLMDEVESLAKIGAWDYNIQTQELYWTDETYHIYGLPIGELVTPELGISFYSQEAQQEIRSAFNRILTDLKPYELELPFIDANGNRKWIRTTGRVLLSDKTITHLYGAFEDITEQKKLFDAQRVSSQNLKTIVDNLNDSIVTISEKGIIRSANRIVEKIFGYLPSELIGKNVSILMPEPFASKHDKYMQSYLQTGHAKIIGVGRELPAIRKNGSTFPMELSISEVLDANEKVFIGIVRDITARKKAEQEIHQLAYYDSTTKVLNKNSFDRDMKKSFDKSLLLNEKTSALLINLDKFSQINLIYGEAVGDKVLAVIANKLSTNLPSWAMVYRNTADSFYILLNLFDTIGLDDKPILPLEQIAKSILDVINQVIKIDDHNINIRASIGILDLPVKSIAYEDIKPLLELSVFKAKQQGGNCIVYAENSEIAILKRHSELSLAIKNTNFYNELSIVLQPQYSCRGKIVGSEVLVRWHSNSLGWISPAEFIPLAEKSNDIISLGSWVINEACYLLAERKKISKNVSPISINLSSKQIAQPNFISNLLFIVDKHKISYSELMLEITESALIADFDLVIDKIKTLKKKGFKFSIDDFGTGYSSLSYIHLLPISELKIDKCFIDDIKDAHTSIPIINTIIQMAHSLKLKVVAEGVESKYQLEYLSKHSCDVIQGYYFSKPLISEKWLDYWE